MKPTINEAAKDTILHSLRSIGMSEHDADMVFRARTVDLDPPKGESLAFKASAGDPSAVDVFIYGDIGIDPWTGEGNSAKQLVDALPTLNAARTVNFYVNSGGGDVFEADALVAVINRLSARKVMHVDGIAASAASYLIQAGDERRVSEHAMIMIHNSMGGVIGNASDMIAMSKTLEKIDEQIAGIYARRSGGDADDFRDAMAAETWYTAQEAIDDGLADTLVVGKQVAARLDPSRYGKMPAWAKTKIAAASKAPAQQSDIGRRIAEAMAEDKAMRERRQREAVEGPKAAEAEDLAERRYQLRPVLHAILDYIDRGEYDKANERLERAFDLATTLWPTTVTINAAYEAAARRQWDRVVSLVNSARAEM